jgi:hypothetical protein
MGMDVSGRNPTSPEGEYFRASIWRWPLLVKVITTLCPQETSPCKHWKTNEGDGLTKRIFSDSGVPYPLVQSRNVAERGGALFAFVGEPHDTCEVGITSLSAV